MSDLSEPTAPDLRRFVPRTDDMLAEPAIAAAASRLGRDLVKAVVRAQQHRVRAGELPPGDLVDATLDALPDSATSMRRVLNASGVVVHTNLGRAPLSPAAVEALRVAAGTTDVELDLTSGRRGRRGAGALDALLGAVPAAEDSHVVNNGAAALALLATAHTGREVVVARGELVEIGDGFRIPELLTSCGVRLREVGTTNRVRMQDYADAIGPDTAFVLKVHPSNFVVSGFTSSVPVEDLSSLAVPVVADIGSGLLHPHPRLPAEPDADSALRAGAALVTASGDKLLGGPQAGLMLGRSELVQALRRHPFARAVRLDKLALAALEATLRGPRPPVLRALDTHPQQLHDRARGVVHRLQQAGVAAEALSTEATVGGGGAPGVALPSAAVAVPPTLLEPLRRGSPAVQGRLAGGRALLDLIAIAPDEDELLATCVQIAAKG